jgi:hypothetical protein
MENERKDTMKKTRDYRGVPITRSTEPGYRLPWRAYVDDHFVSADTLAGLKALIRQAQGDRS